MDWKSRAAAWLLIAFLPLAAPAQAQRESLDRTLSPYFFVRGDSATEQLPLRSTDVDATVAGVIADVKVKQQYRNDGKTPIEAEYVFPGSSSAALLPAALAASYSARACCFSRISAITLRSPMVMVSA